MILKQRGGKVGICTSVTRKELREENVLFIRFEKMLREHLDLKNRM